MKNCLLVWAISAALGNLSLATPAIASDPEARIAELDVSLANKGSRKISLMVSGQVNNAITAWDDGTENNVYVVDNDFAQTLVRVQGKAEVAKGWGMGCRLEIGLDDASSDSVSQNDPGASRIM